MNNQKNSLRQEIIEVGKKVYEKGLAVANSGNLSLRLDKDNIWITAAGTCLGNLASEDIIKVDLASGKSNSQKSPTSELTLHSLIYKNFSHRVVIHCHPPLINGYFAVVSDLKALTFETKFYLGQVPVIPQDTPTVTSPQPVIEALKTNNLAVLKNHGVIAAADKFKDALALVLVLEEAVKTVALARLFKKDILDDLDKALKDDLVKKDTAYP